MLMESGQRTLSDLRSGLASRGGMAFVRMAADARLRSVWYVDVVVGAPNDPPGWQPQVWRYSEAMFIASQVEIAALTAALDSAGGQTLALDDYVLPFSALSEQVSWQRKPSRARYESIVIPWPVSNYSLSSPDRSYTDRRPQGFLIGDDCPSFPSTRRRSGRSSTATSHPHRPARCQRSSPRYESSTTAGGLSGEPTIELCRAPCW